MTELLTASQMRAIEQAAIESGEVTGLELMERAGRGVVEAIFEEWPELAKTDHRAVVLCGPGNNGGDGFVVARLLHEWGWEVEVFLYGNADKLPTDARVNYERWLELGEVNLLEKGVLDKVVERAAHYEGSDLDGYPAPELGRQTIFVDALFGTGLSRPLPKELGDIATYEWFDYCWEKGVAIDFPSGICADSGRVLSESGWFCAKLTVTFHESKCGHYLGNWNYDCPSLRCIDLGLRDVPPQDNNSVWINTHLPCSTSDYSGFALNKLNDSHKYTHGHAYVLSGPVTKTGACRLAAGGALRIGAGLVTVGAPKDALVEHAAQLNAIMLSEMNGAEDFYKIIEDKRINTLCIGPAFGLSQDRADLVAAVLNAKRATVLDADALTLLSMHPNLMKLLHKDCVLTPHRGEFARIFPDIADKLNAVPAKGPVYSKVEATREAAKRAGCVVLFKGPDTVIAEPDGRCSINSAHYERSAPWLATAGSGDVLAGFITGLLARGFAPIEAAETAAWLHVECALNFGPGLIAEDLPEQLPEVFRKLGV